MNEVYQARLNGRSSEKDIIVNDMKKMFNGGVSHRILDVEDLNKEVHTLDFVILDKDYASKKSFGDTNRKFYVLKPGQYVESGWSILDLYDSDWLVMNASNLVDVVYKGVLYRKNATIKVKQPNGLYKILPACVYGTDSRQGQEDFHRITLPSASLEINVPITADTSHIKRDEHIILDDIWWLVLRVDKYSEPNVLRIYVEEALSPRDVDIEIDDGMPLPVPDPDPDSDPVVLDPEIEGVDETFINTPQTFSLINYTEPYTWVISRNPGMVNIVENIPDGNITLVVPYRAGISGRSFTLQAISGELVLAQKVVTVKSM